MAVELATGYINLVPSMRGFSSKVASEFDPAALGKTMGRKLGTGMTTGIQSTVQLPQELRTQATTTGKTSGVNFKKGFESETDRIKLPDKMAGEAKGKGKESGSQFGNFFALGAASAVAVGTALVVDGFKEALGREVSTVKMGQQLGLTPTFAKGLGETTGRIFAQNFGDSLEQVNTAAVGVLKNIGGAQTPATFDDLVKKALTFSSTMNQDVNRSTAAAGQLIRTGLAKDGSEAFDILTRAMQGPSNQADDLLDTTIEYSTLMRNLGLSGPQSFGLISQAVKGGARSSDQAADALKEFSIRAVDGSDLTANSFGALGLDARKMAGDIAAGGSRAATALDTTLDALRGVADPVKRGQIAVGLFGTQAEDMGKALETMDLDTTAAEMDNVAGAANRMVDAVGGTKLSKFDEFKRSIQTNVVDFMETTGIPILEAGADAFHNIFGEDAGASLRTGAGLFASAWDDIFGADAGASLRTGVGLFASAWDDVSANFTTGVDTIKTGTAGLWTDFTTGLTTVKTTASDLWTNFTTGLDTIKTTGADLWTNFTTGADTVKTFFTDLVTAATELPGRIGDALKGLWDALPATFKAALDVVVDVWNGLAIPQIGPYTISAFGRSQDIGPFGPFDLPDIPTPWRHADRGGIVPGAIGSEQFLIAHGGETIVPTHKPQLAAFRGIDGAVASAASVGAGGGASVPTSPTMIFNNVREADTAWTVRHELHKFSLLAGGR